LKPTNVTTVDEERALLVRIQSMIDQNLSDIAYYWKFGDGNGGGLLMLAQEALNNHNLIPHNAPDSIPNSYLKRKLPTDKKKAVLERDLYRCLHCGTHLDLCVDHVKPERLGGSSELTNLQTLCRSCNSQKGMQYTP
jgi:hypothetical protein